MDKLFTNHLLLLASTLLLLSVSLSSYAEGIQRVSVDSSGVEGNGGSSRPSTSADGRYIAFESYASNLIAGDSNNSHDIFVHDRITGNTTRVSHNTDGTQANGNSVIPSLSADGRYVAFLSIASNLVADDTNGLVDIFVHDRNTGVTTRVNLNTDGTQANSDSLNTSLSADGRYVAFSSWASNLVAGDTNHTEDIFVHDRNTGATTRVSLNTDGTQANGFSRDYSLSADGRYVAFSSGASNLVADDTNGTVDTFVHDRNTGVTTRVNLNTDGTQANGGSIRTSLSADGRYVAFISRATNLVPDDINHRRDIFVHDRNNSTTTLISRSTDGRQGNENTSINFFLSADGRYVIFLSEANNLVAGDTNNRSDFFVHDRNTGFTSLFNHSVNGIITPVPEFVFPSLSADGRYLIFSTAQTNLVAGDSTGHFSDVFISPTLLYKTRNNDFNLDGKADILWRNTMTGLNYLYQMDGTSIASHGQINTVDDPDWQIKGTADFDGDRKADILWRHATTGLNYLYLMDGTSVSFNGPIDTVDDLDWKIDGVGDFNGDGKADILWRNATTGLNYLFFMDGNSVASHGLINTADDLNWQIKGVGDFNSDGKADILWRHAVTGANYLYLMDGTSIVSSGEINTLVDLDWKIKGVADFNGDGKADILWRHATSGQNWIYLMDGTSITDNGGINIVSDADWQIKGAADFNDDGKADILWRHATSGLNYLYLMDGISIISHGAINDVPDPDWQIQ